MILAFDIETIPDPHAVAMMPAPDVKTGNLKDPEKIAAKIAEAKAAQVEKAALDPLTARVACVGFVGGDGLRVANLIGEETDESERSVIQWTFDRMSADDLRLVTFNGLGFDLPMLYRRALILGVDPAHFGAPPLSAWTKRYGNDRHFDLMQIWTGGQGFASLDSIARIVLRRTKVDFDVATIPEMLKTDLGRESVIRYNLADCDLTLDMFQRFNGTLIS